MSEPQTQWLGYEHRGYQSTQGATHPWQGARGATRHRQATVASPVLPKVQRAGPQNAAAPWPKSPAMLSAGPPAPTRTRSTPGRSPLQSSVSSRNSACPVSDSSFPMDAAEQNWTMLGCPESFFCRCLVKGECHTRTLRDTAHVTSRHES